MDSETRISIARAGVVLKRGRNIVILWCRSFGITIERIKSGGYWVETISARDLDSLQAYSATQPRLLRRRSMSQTKDRGNKLTAVPVEDLPARIAAAKRVRYHNHYYFELTDEALERELASPSTMPGPREMLS